MILPLPKNWLQEIKLLPQYKEKYLVYEIQAFRLAFFSCEEMIFSFFIKIVFF